MAASAVQPTAAHRISTTSGDTNYERGRRVWNGMIDRRPAGVLRCTSANDVRTGLSLARAAGLRVSVRAHLRSDRDHRTRQRHSIASTSDPAANCAGAGWWRTGVAGGSILGCLHARLRRGVATDATSVTSIITERMATPFGADRCFQGVD